MKTAEELFSPRYSYWDELVFRISTKALSKNYYYATPSEQYADKPGVPVQGCGSNSYNYNIHSIIGIIKD